MHVKFPAYTVLKPDLKTAGKRTLWIAALCSQHQHAECEHLDYCIRFREISNAEMNGLKECREYLIGVQDPLTSGTISLGEVPDSLRPIFDKMLAKNPEDRYQSFDEIIAALESIDMTKLKDGE